MTNEQLVIRIKASEDTAENMLQLWLQNRKMVCKIANRYKDMAEVEDLIQEGYLGLNKAVCNYDTESGVLFMSYAVFWIRQSITRYIKSNGSVRIPEHALNLCYKIRKMESQWTAAFGRKPTDREVCHYLDITYKELEQARVDARMITIKSLDVPVGDDEESSLYELVPSQTNMEDDVIDKLQQEQLRTTIWKLVDTLEEQQPDVIRMRYQDGMTLKETGERIGCDLNRARTIEAKALRELRKPSNSKQLRPFLREERIRSISMSSVSAAAFERTWTSSTEKAALWLSER